MLSNPVVVHFKDGSLKKGYLKKFAFYRDNFTFLEIDKRTRTAQKVKRILILLILRQSFCEGFRWQ